MSTYAYLSAHHREHDLAPGLAVVDVLATPAWTDEHGADLGKATDLLAEHGWELSGPWHRSDELWYAAVTRPDRPWWRAGPAPARRHGQPARTPRNGRKERVMKRAEKFLPEPRTPREVKEQRLTPRE